MTEILTSPRNPRVRWVRKLGTDARLRREEGVWLAEGPRLADEVLRAGLPVRLWVFAEDWGSGGTREARLRETALREGTGAVLSRAAFRGLADTEAPQGVLCVVDAPVWSIGDVLARPGPVLALDGVQDPGNLGTLARSAEAAGAAGLLLGPPAVDAGNPKALRASAGSLLRLPVAGVPDLAAALRGGGRRVLAASGRGGAPYDQVDLTLPFALLVGQEGRGVSQALLDAADLTVTIPMAREVESLNAATAAAVVLFESARQCRQNAAAR